MKRNAAIPFWAGAITCLSVTVANPLVGLFMTVGFVWGLVAAFDPAPVEDADGGR